MIPVSLGIKGAGGGGVTKIHFRPLLRIGLGTKYLFDGYLKDDTVEGFIGEELPRFEGYLGFEFRQVFAVRLTIKRYKKGNSFKFLQNYKEKK